MLLLGLRPLASGVTFTSDTVIAPNNNAYDGQDIAVSNCTLTVDGPHGFLSVHVLGGGILTHSSAPNGIVGTNSASVIGEPHLVSPTNSAALNLSNVVAATVMVTDATGTNTYVLGTDYGLAATNGYTWISILPGSSLTNTRLVLASYTALLAPVYAGLNLVVTNDVEIDPGGGIDANGRGYGAGYGPGAGAARLTNSPYAYYAGSGGGHGGFGGNSSSQAAGGACYGSILNASSLGSGGGAGSGAGGAGGGLVNLTLGGTLRVDGRISADGAAGTNPHSGGGSGGSIWVMAQTISGAGSISAKGGAGELYDGGGGGGGQIAIYWNASNAAPGTNAFTGTLSAQGGAGAAAGGAGTIYSSGGTTIPAAQLRGGQCRPKRHQHPAVSLLALRPDDQRRRDRAALAVGGAPPTRRAIQ